MDEAVVVTLPTQTRPSREQKIFGKKSPLSPEIEEFRGLPYGIVPARWQHSILRTSLPEDAFDASRNGPKCPQPSEFNNTDTFQSYVPFPSDVVESEFDCLNLFITRPSPAALAKTGIDIGREKLPVYFYIHGGGFAFGAGTDPMWDPARLVSTSLALGKPIIVATINYRLHLFGFAASSGIIDAQPTDQLKGCNFGLGDQRTALLWVCRNISAFGGDHTRITIGGQSAGSISVHSHVQEAKYGSAPPLFRRAIMQSAALGTLWPLSMEEAEADWEALCRHLDLDPRKEESAVQSSAAELVKAARDLKIMSFAPFNDGLTVRTRGYGEWEVHLARMDEDSTVVKQEDSRPIAVMIGDTDVEGVIYQHSVFQVLDFEHLRTLFETAYSSSTLSTEVLNAYGLTPDLPLSALHTRLTTFMSDFRFGHPISSAREQLSHHDPNGNVKPANRSTHSPHNRITSTRPYRVKFGNPFPGPFHGVAHHCVDLVYLYDCFHDALREVDRTATENGTVSNAALVRELQEDWIRFIADEAVSDDDDEAFAKVYEVDRSTKMVRMATDTEWVARTERLDVLARHWDETQRAARAILDIGREKA